MASAKTTEHTEAPGGAHADGGNPFLKLDPGVGIWTIVLFFLLLGVLKKFAWGPIISSLDEREKNIRDSLDKAKEAQNESKRIATEQNEVLAEAKAEAASLISKAKESAEEIAAKIKNEAQEEKNRIVESGVKEIEAAKAAAIQTLKEQTADLSIQIAEKLIRKSMDDNTNRDYVNKLIEEIES